MANPKDIRNATFTTSSGTDVKNTRMLKGEAKDSLKGSNSTTEYSSGGGSIQAPKDATGKH